MLETAIMSQYFIEEYKATKITINATNNQFGYLSLDERDNYLNSGLIGRQSVYKCTTFSNMTADKYLLVHNADDEILGMVSGTYDKETGDISGIKNNFSVVGQDIITYKINTGIEYGEFSGSSFTMSDVTASDTIFKIYINGRDETNYTRVGAIITINSGETNLYGNNACIIYYPNLQTLGTVDIELYYYSPYDHSVISEDDLLLGHEVSPTITGNATTGTNTITTTTTVSTMLDIFDYIRIGNEVKKVLNIITTTIYVDSDFEETYSGEIIYYTPYALIANIDSEQENLSPTFETFASKGVKLPVKIKTAVNNTFTFDYFVDNDMEISVCNVYNYITDEVEKHFDTNNKMRVIRAYYNEDSIEKFIYLTNIRKIESIPYSKGAIDKYSVILEFEDKLILTLTDYDILGAGAVGNYLITRE